MTTAARSGRNRESIIPRDRDHWLSLRAADVTSTEAAALFGLHPRLTLFELWHRKKNRDVIEIADNSRMRWGRQLEAAIANGIAEDEDAVVANLRDYMRLPDARMGSSFDFEFIGCADDSLLTGWMAMGTGILEIKKVDSLVFRDEWTPTDSGYEAPDHIELQLQHQLHVSGRKWGAIGVLVGGNDAHLLTREYDPDIGDAIEARVRELYRSIEAGEEPEPEWPADARFVASLHGSVDPDKVYDGRGDAGLESLCVEYRLNQEAETEARKRKETAKAKIYRYCGDAERALVDGYSCWIGWQKDSYVEAHTRSGGRRIRVTAKKANK